MTVALTVSFKLISFNIYYLSNMRDRHVVCLTTISGKLKIESKISDG